MKENRLMQQVTAIFSTLMVVFYLGIGFYLVFSPIMTYVDKPVRVMIGSAFIFYGSYRAYRAYVTIVEVFFRKNEDED
jgi:hypothetical protein